jgi:hypothetical protein
MPNLDADLAKVAIEIVMQHKHLPGISGAPRHDEAEDNMFHSRMNGNHIHTLR